MLYRILTLAFVLLVSLSLLAQNNNDTNDKATKPGCTTSPCVTPNHFASAPTLPSAPLRGKWAVEDFKTTDASVSCSVVKYDSTVTRPILHLLCPGRDIFAPLRVHLTLTWKDVAQIPSAMRSMLVDMNKAVKFKSSKGGDSKAEITLQDPQASRSVKEWVTFTQVNVGLVLPNKTE